MSASQQLSTVSVSPSDDFTRWSWRNALLCALITITCMLAAYPFAPGPYSDDFSYTKTALDFARTGHIAYNGWGAAMLGWMIPWGALFIKLFGFSFNVVRLSTWPLAIASSILFHQILVRFGIMPRNAILGTLTLALSPLSLILSVSFMTDVPGLFIILLCLYLCQRAVATTSNRLTLLFLAAATLIGVIGGTARQTSWLGALVMVPSTAWLLRRRRFVLPGGAILAGLSLVGVLLSLKWAASQPYFVTEPFLYRPFNRYRAIMLTTEMVKGSFCLLLLLFPVLVAWLPEAPKLSRGSRIRIGALWACLGAFGVLPANRGLLNSWLMPWLDPTLADLGMRDSRSILGTVVVLSHVTRLAISVIVLTTALIVAELTLASVRKLRAELESTLRPWKAAFWLIVPFALSYLLLLGPRSSIGALSDRYLLGLMPCAIVFLLLLFQGSTNRDLPAVSIAALAVFSLFAIMGTHDFYAEIRANEAAIQELRNAGVPRTAIAGSFNSDAWVQLSMIGYINDPHMVSASTVYQPHVPSWNLPSRCETILPQSLDPVIRPQYFIVWSQDRCLVPSPFAPVTYRAWLPPFHRRDYVQQLQGSLKDEVRR